MKIDFTILWVDDNKDFVDSIRPQLEKWMDIQGLGLKICWHPRESGIYSDLDKGNIELIILDYHLKGGKNGDAIISEIRKKGFYEDIVFYTTKSNTNTLFKVSPDGVFFSERDDAKDRIKDLLNIKIRRSLDLATLRGWIVADSIELEILLLTVLASFFKDHGELSRDRAMKVLSEDGAFFFGRLREYVNDALKKNIHDLTTSPEDGIFDFGGKHKVLNGIVKDHISALQKQSKNTAALKFQACKKILDVFPQEIIEIRNALAHQIAEVSETGHKKLKSKTKAASELVITPEKCVEIRKNIRKHFENLTELNSLAQTAS